MRSLLRKAIYANDFLYDLYFDYGNISSLTMLDKTLKEFINKKKCSSFIQIGANDGFSNDPLYKFIRRYKLQGIYVEPQKEYFKILRNLHKHDGINVKNGAIGLKNGPQNIYYLNFSNSRWATGLTSFNDNQLKQAMKTNYIKKNARAEGIKIDFDNLDKYISCYEIDTVTFPTLMKENNLEKIDIICIDVEGFESELIPTIDLHFYGVKILIYEHRHLKLKDQNKINQHLDSFDFKSIKCEYDTISIKK